MSYLLSLELGKQKGKKKNQKTRIKQKMLFYSGILTREPAVDAGASLEFPHHLCFSASMGLCVGHPWDPGLISGAEQCYIGNLIANQKCLYVQ